MTSAQNPPSRRDARSLSFQFLYSMAEPLPSTISQKDFQNFCKSFENPYSDFAWETAQGVIAHLNELDEKIGSVSKNWRIERMPQVDLSILRLALYEIFHCPDIPRSVSINEAIELAKKFGAEGSTSFINGILDKFSKPE